MVLQDFRFGFIATLLNYGSYILEHVFNDHDEIGRAKTTWVAVS
jgi:hypothetical protein